MAGVQPSVVTGCTERTGKEGEIGVILFVWCGLGIASKRHYMGMELLLTKAEH